MRRIMLNRMGNVRNPYQGKYKRVLCVCSAGMLRSPTAALVLSQEPFNFNTRSCGIDKEFALIPLDEVLLAWADEIVVMNTSQEIDIRKLSQKTIINLQIEDNYEYRDKGLMYLIKKHYEEKI